MPVLKKVGKSAIRSVGKEVAASGSNFMSDVIKGVSVKKAAKSRSKQALQNVLKKGQRMVVGETGSNPPGKKRKSRKRKNSTGGNRGGKRIRSDVFNVAQKHFL